MDQGAYDVYSGTPYYVNHVEAQENWLHYFRGDLPYSVGKFVQDLIEEGDYSFNIHNEPLKMKDDFIRIFEDEWLPLRKQIYEDILCLGLVVVKFKPKWDAPRIITRAIGSRFVIQIHYNRDTMQLEYQYVDKKKMMPFAKKTPSSHKIFILSGGFDPLPNGSLTCIMSHIRMQNEYAILNYHWHMQATNVLSKPEILLRTEKDRLGARQGESLALLDFESETMRQKYGEKDVDTSRMRRLMEKRIRDSAEVTAAAMLTQMSESEKMVLSRPELREKQSSSVISIPTDGVLNYQLPQTRNDWEIMHRILYEIICAVFGVPAQYVTSLGVKYARAGGQLEMSDKRIAKTVNNWRNRIQTIFTQMYLFKFGRKIPISISFSRYHREEYEILKQKYLDGIILKHEFVNMVRSEMGLPTLSPEEIEKLSPQESDEGEKKDKKKKKESENDKEEKKDKKKESEADKKKESEDDKEEPPKKKAKK